MTPWFFQYQQSLKMYEAAKNRAKDLQIKMVHFNDDNKRIKDEIVGGDSLHEY